MEPDKEWLMLRDSIVTKDNLTKGGWRKGTEFCQFCDKKETIQHVFFECPLVRLTWNVVICAFNMKQIKDLRHILGPWIQTCDKITKQLLLVGIAE